MCLGDPQLKLAKNRHTRSETMTAHVDGARPGAARGSEAGMNRSAAGEDGRGLRCLSHGDAGNPGEFNARCAESRLLQGLSGTFEVPNKLPQRMSMPTALGPPPTNRLPLGSCGPASRLSCLERASVRPHRASFALFRCAHRSQRGRRYFGEIRPKRAVSWPKAHAASQSHLSM